MSFANFAYGEIIERSFSNPTPAGVTDLREKVPTNMQHNVPYNA